MLFLCLYSLLFAHSLAYKTSRFLVLNGVTYNETYDQPWFRRRHDPHLPVPTNMTEKLQWGQHILPDNDVYIEHEWTEREKKYMACMDLPCICPCYNGKVVGRKCILPGGKVLKKAVRKEIRTLTEKERHQVERAFDLLKSSGVFDRIGLVHKYKGVHEGPGFYTWHREFLKRAEFLLRQYLPAGSSLGLPYWDSSLDADLPEPADSIFFSPLFVGDVDGDGYVTSGPYAHWKVMEGTRKVQRFVGSYEQGEVLNRARIDFVLNMTDIKRVLAPVMPLETCPSIMLDDRLLEYSHDYVHDFINGDMKESYSSGSEIIFYFHHAMVDNIWEMWRQKRQTREERESQYPPDLPTCYPPKHFASWKMIGLEPLSNKDVLSNAYTDNLFEYTKRPSCVNNDMECESRYLFCYKGETGNEAPRCMSKVRLGGSCNGFSGHDICHQGYCNEEGVCKPLSYPAAM